MIEEYESKPCSVEGCHGKMTYSNRVPAPAADAVVAGSEIKALFMTVWCPDSRSVESNCGIPRG